MAESTFENVAFRRLSENATLARISPGIHERHRDIYVPVYFSSSFCNETWVHVQVVQLDPPNTENNGPQIPAGRGMEADDSDLADNNAAEFLLTTRVIKLITSDVAEGTGVVVRIKINPLQVKSDGDLGDDPVSWPPNSGVVVVVNSGASGPRHG